MNVPGEPEPSDAALEAQVALRHEVACLSGSRPADEAKTRGRHSVRKIGPGIAELRAPKHVRFLAAFLARTDSGFRGDDSHACLNRVRSCNIGRAPELRAARAVRQHAVILKRELQGRHRGTDRSRNGGDGARLRSERTTAFRDPADAANHSRRQGRLMLSGHVPDTDITPGRVVDGERLGQPGRNRTFVAPKSFSLETLCRGRGR